MNRNNLLLIPWVLSVPPSMRASMIHHGTLPQSSIGLRRGGGYTIECARLQIVLRSVMLIRNEDDGFEIGACALLYLYGLNV